MMAFRPLPDIPPTSSQRDALIQSSMTGLDNRFTISDYAYGQDVKETDVSDLKAVRDDQSWGVESSKTAGKQPLASPVRCIFCI